MDLKPIKTEADYQAALNEIEKLFGAEQGMSDGDRLEVLATVVEAYEARHYDMPAPDPVEAISYFMESRGLTRADLEPYTGSRARVSEVLNRKRPLTLSMIQCLNARPGIPAEILVKPYKVRTSQKSSRHSMTA
jgi:HTH-type transcriptional regulator / antitoxin HigA